MKSMWTASNNAEMAGNDSMEDKLVEGSGQVACDTEKGEFRRRSYRLRKALWYANSLFSQLLFIEFFFLNSHPNPNLISRRRC